MHNASMQPAVFMLERLLKGGDQQWVLLQVQDVMKKGPQQMMAEMASGMTANNAQKHFEAVRQAKLTVWQ